MANEQLVELIEQLTDLVSSFEEHYINNSRSGEITLPQLRYLEAITSLENPTISDIAEALGVKLPSVTAALKTLSEKNLVQKTQDTFDKRVVKVKLSLEGQRIANLHRKAHEAIAEMMQKRLRKSEVKTLMNLLVKTFQTEAEHE